MRKILDVYEYLVATRLVAAADAGALPLLLSWAGCMTFNRDLLVEISPLTRMGAHLPQVAWAAVASLIAVFVVRGLLLRERHRGEPDRHRPARHRALLAMGGFFAWVTFELAISNVGLPALYWNLWGALWCVLGAGRLKRLMRQDAEETSRL